MKCLAGWISWLLVATIIYATVSLSVDDYYYFFLPLSVYELLWGLVGATSVDAKHTVAVWSTAMVGTTVLHALVWLGCWCLQRTSITFGSFRLYWRRRIFPFVGWTSWLLVLTIAIVIVSDEVRRGRDGSLPTLTAAEIAALYMGVFSIVGLIHLAALRLVRSRS